MLGEFYGNAYYSFSFDDSKLAPPVGFKDRLRLTVLRRHLGYDVIDPSLTVNAPWFVTAALRTSVAVPTFKSGGYLLDVGCGAGEKLMEFRSLGWKVRGIELSLAAAQAGAQRGIDIDVGPLDRVPYPENQFSAMTFYHSLEHLPSPTAALRAAYRLLEPGGQLLVVVPNFNSLERKIFGKNWGWMQVPIHFYHFTRPVLARAVLSAGFSLHSLGYSFSGQSIGGLAEGLLRPASIAVRRVAGPFGMLCALLGTGKALVAKARKPVDPRLPSRDIRES